MPRSVVSPSEYSISRVRTPTVRSEADVGAAEQPTIGSDVDEDAQPVARIGRTMAANAAEIDLLRWARMSGIYPAGDPAGYARTMIDFLARRTTLAGIGGLLAAFTTPAFAEIAPSSTDRPHIVVAMIDDLGWQDVSVPFGPNATPFNHRYRTPNLERLANRGTIFTDGYAASPVCTPTRTAFMTGLHPGRTGITYWTLHADRDNSTKHPRLTSPAWRLTGLDDTDITLAHLLDDAGYHTIHVGKAHFGAIGTPGADPANLGFDVNIAGHAAGGPGSFLGVHDFGAQKRQGKTGPSVWDVPGLDEYHGRDVYLTEALAEKAVAALRDGVASGDPVFLHFAPYAVHAPIMGNHRYLDRYPGLDSREAAYATMIESMDAALGRILDTLDELDIADDTIVVFLGDNGGLSAHARGGTPHVHNAPLRSGKGSAYEGGVRVPFVIALPGDEDDGHRESTPVTAIDLLPTLTELANVEVPADHAAILDGESIVALLDERTPRSGPARDRPLVWTMPHQWGASGPGIEPFTSIRRGDWKLLWFHDGPRVELYDLANDLGETTDVATDHPDLVQELLSELDAWYAETGASRSLLTATGEPIGLPSSSTDR
jgi:arylsulfatase A-like enzyme